MFCGQRDPGRVGKTAIGRRWLKLKFGVHKQQRDVEQRLRQITLPNWAQPLHTAGAVTNTLIAVCVSLYLLILIGGALSGAQTRSLFAPSGQILDQIGMAGRVSFSEGRVWGLLTAVYLHGGILHLLGNMVVLWRFGHSVEMLFGRMQYFLIFTVSGLVGTIFTTVRGTSYAVGASGAIFGLLGALIYYWSQDRSPYARQMMQQVALFAIVIFLMGATTPNVDNPGHLGGFVGGLAAAYGLGQLPYYASHPLFTRAAQAALLLTVAAFLFSAIAQFN